jgi:hypothetical protein
MARYLEFLSQFYGFRLTHVHWVSGTVYAIINWPGREADNFAPTTEVTNGGAIPPLPSTFSWRRAQLIKHRDKTKKKLNSMA